jgi:signal transduction histidine kinase/DNA-binding response OmpR family regulator
MDPLPRPATAPTRVLVVDDNPDGLFITGKLLESAGYDVVTAPDGLDALRVFGETHPQLVLSDVVMPGLDGRELCRRIKADPANANVLVALISGIETLPQNVADGLDCGADEYLTRPIATAELFARLRSLERLHHARSALAETARQRELASLELEQRVHERTAELAQATKRLEAEVTERRKSNDTLAAFAQLANRLNSATTIRDAAQIIVDTARVLLGWDSCSLVLCPPGTGRAEPVLNMDLVDGRCQTVEPAVKDGSITPMTRRVMRRGPELILRTNPGKKVPRLTPFGDAARQSQSMLFAPIHHGPHAIGVLSIQSYSPQAYDTGSLGTLLALAEHCGGALERIHTQEALRRQAVRLRLLNNLSPSLLAPLGVREMAATACQCLEREFGYYNVALLTKEADTGQLILEANAGAYGSFLKPGEYRQLTGKGIIGRVAQSGRRCVVQDVAKWPGFFELVGMAIRSEVAVPIRVRGRVAGVLNVDCDRVHGFEPADVELLETVAGLLAAGFERARLFGDVEAELAERKRAESTLRELPARTLAAQEAERRRIASELHDSVSQILSSAKFRLHAGESALSAPVARRHRQFRRGRELLDLALKEIRRITRNLRPSELDDLGLVPALGTLLDEFKDRTGLRVSFRAPRSMSRIPPAVGLAAYRIVQEALANIERHAHARAVCIRLAGTARGLKLHIADDGRGIQPRRLRSRARGGTGLGLVHMRERAAALGGSVHMETTLRKGTRITVDLPFAPHSDRSADNPREPGMLRP